MDSLNGVGDARSLAQIVVETVREPLLVLDEDFTILAASDSFYKSFETTPAQTLRHPFFAMDDGAWDIPQVRQLLGRALAEDNPIEGFALDRDFPRIGSRNFLLYLRHARPDDIHRMTILLGFEDITERRVIEHEKDRLQQQSEGLLKRERVLLEEMQHRIVNSLQIIASILMMKARSVSSQETREHLQDAHRRVMSVAEVQKYLHSTVGNEKIELGPYLTKLCTSLAGSMIGEASHTKLQAVCDEGWAISSEAVSIGLIVTELVINALKYAFPDKEMSGVVTVRYEANNPGWTLSVTDNGVGKRDDSPAKGGLGTSLVAALAHQLGAEVRSRSGADGMSVSIVNAKLALAANAA
jgi:chemotaxis protein methyltransferase CheR